MNCIASAQPNSSKDTNCTATALQILCVANNCCMECRQCNWLHSSLIESDNVLCSENPLKGESEHLSNVVSAYCTYNICTYIEMCTAIEVRHNTNLGIAKCTKSMWKACRSFSVATYARLVLLEACYLPLQYSCEHILCARLQSVASLPLCRTGLHHWLH